MARVDGLRAAALFFQLAALMNDPLSLDPAARKAEPEHARELHACWAGWRSVVITLEDLVSAEEGARASLEHQYLDGRPALFTDARTHDGWMVSHHAGSKALPSWRLRSEGW
jgi:hypothetical protein